MVAGRLHGSDPMPGTGPLARVGLGPCPRASAWVKAAARRLRCSGERGAPWRGVPFATMSASVAIEERKKLLNDVWLFHGAGDEELTALAELAYEVTIGPHVDIVKENEFGDELFLVVDGHAAVTRGGVDLSVLNAGDFFGEMALLGTGVRTSTVRSIVAMTLLGLRAEHFDDVLASDSAVARRVLSVVVRRLESADRRLAELEGRFPSS
jgi:CRP-like cAMP-binding protein